LDNVHYVLLKSVARNRKSQLISWWSYNSKSRKQKRYFFVSSIKQIIWQE
jgi:hypothetical protein